MYDNIIQFKVREVLDKEKSDLDTTYNLLKERLLYVGRKLWSHDKKIYTSLIKLENSKLWKTNKKPHEVNSLFNLIMQKIYVNIEFDKDVNLNMVHGIPINVVPIVNVYYFLEIFFLHGELNSKTNTEFSIPKIDLKYPLLNENDIIKTIRSDIGIMLRRFNKNNCIPYPMLDILNKVLEGRLDESDFIELILTLEKLSGFPAVVVINEEYELKLNKDNNEASSIGQLSLSALLKFYNYIYLKQKNTLPAEK